MMANWGTNNSWGNNQSNNQAAGWGGNNAPQEPQQDEDQVYGWDDTYTCEEGGGYVLLAPGEYDFTVKKFERGYYNGSDDGKNKACPMAKLTFEVSSPDGPAKVTDTLFLKSSSKWKLDDFFRCIGVAKVGQAYTPNWNNIIGMTGRAKIKNRENNGKKYNNLDRYVYPKG